ncbi:nucleotide sugar dehydrogenase [Halodesulfurarchaeum formicicum]|uniref:UDP-N-acetyl-D-mannosamine dehydrogenase n=1 Tax=Halodesulfurarchaeum formicicum TaxID=1873524 RepID=A0A1J1ABB3_9EURY|nr:nucleotide sugar dehydrogenase [Halodesulfurarchaeum formicicum]APE95088.1 nucleotide sugar dehydrogenase [Halodesulfurarchaeum formicicum]
MSPALGAHSGLYDTTATEADQRAAFTSGEVPVAVYGLGKMGLPLAAVYAEVTGNTIGVDIDPEVVESINAGNTHVKREPGLAELVTAVVDNDDLRATTDGEAAAEEAAVHVLMVPTLLTDDRQPDLSLLDEVVETVGAGLSPGDVVFVESTVPPRTTADRVVPNLSAASGLDPAAFGAAACPERTVSGQALQDVRGTHPKVVGGVDEESTRAAELVYGEISDNEVVPTSDAATAEAVKVFEGVYRDVNIALANQLARYNPAMDIDVTEAIDVANTQPFCDIHDPGPGVGGHCIPVYPYFLTDQYNTDSSLLTAARDTNDAMPEYTVSNLEAILDAHGVALESASVLLLGVTYKANINELRNAPSIPLVRNLRERGATVYAVDPLLDDWSVVGDIEPLTLEESTDRAVDAVVLVTPHDEFADLDWDRFDAPILDGRDAVNASEVEQPVYTIGGQWP